MPEMAQELRSALKQMLEAVFSGRDTLGRKTFMRDPVGDLCAGVTEAEWTNTASVAADAAERELHLYSHLQIATLPPVVAVLWFVRKQDLHGAEAIRVHWQTLRDSCDCRELGDINGPGTQEPDAKGIEAALADLLRERYPCQSTASEGNPWPTWIKRCSQAINRCQDN